MFNQDNYHWTQDDYTEEGLFIIQEHLKKYGIAFISDNSSIFLTQRMGRKAVRYEISGSLAKDKENLLIITYTAVSTPDEIKDSPLKQPFITAVQEMVEVIKKREKVVKDVKITKKIHIPNTNVQVKTEKLSRKVEFTSSLDHINNTLFNSEIIKAGNPSINLKKDPFSIDHPAIKLTLLFFCNDSSSDALQKNKSVLRAFKAQVESKEFEVNLDLEEKGQGTQLMIRSNCVPLHYSDKFMSYLERILLQPLQTFLRIPYKIVC